MNAPQEHSIRERLASPLTWHAAAFSVLLIGVIVLATRFALDWSATSSRSMDAVQQKQVEIKALEMQTTPLRGLDNRVALSREQMRDFQSKRIPGSYSAIATRIGDLEVKSGVRLTRLQYTPAAPDRNLTEIKLDAGLTGDYIQIMRFVNSLERDKMFFVIRNMGLTGQQSGIVTLRLQVSTWLRPEAAAALPAAQQAAQNPQQEGGTQR